MKLFAIYKGSAKVRVANSGAEGLAACAEFAPDMVFLDIGMPGMDGFETARRTREMPIGSKATLVALTGWGEEETRKRVKEAGFDRHIAKPADDLRRSGLARTIRSRRRLTRTGRGCRSADGAALG